MNSMGAMTRFVFVFTALCVSAHNAAPARGAGNYTQSFDNNGTQTANGPANRVAEGWIFRNQSTSHIENAGWIDGALMGQTAQAGASCLYTASSMTVPFTGSHTLSNWAILPAIPNQAAGDELSFFLLGNPPQFGDQTIQVRYSPSGGTSTGSTATSVGDFTVLIAEFGTNNVWQQMQATIPGPGRIALRQWDSAVSNFPSSGVVMKVDSLAIAANVSVPCGIPLPQPGQTVTWTAANSPYVVCAQLTIPAGGTVIVEPGVAIQVVDGGPQLVISGEMIAHGTQAAPITFTSTNVSIIEPPIEVLGGTLDLNFATIAARIQSKYGGTLIAADCTIPSGGVIAAAPLQAQDPDGSTPQGLTFRIERCSFNGGELSAVSNVGVVDTHFVGGKARVAGYAYLHNVTVDGVPLEIEKDAGAQPMFIDHVTATNSTATGGLQLSGANFHIGPNTVIQGNRWPVEFTTLAAGLTQDSVLPVTGNTLNEINARAFDSGNLLTWPNLGLPYHVDQTAQSGGFLTVFPGVNIRFGEFGGAIFRNDIRLTGTPAQPIVLERANAAQSWNGIEFFQVAAQRVQNVTVRGARFGVGSDESDVTVIDSVFRENDVAGTANTFGRWGARNCEFLDNNIGLQTGSTFNAGYFDAAAEFMPNTFAGNGVGVAVNDPFPGNPSAANYCWWGDPSGPTHPFNPEGVGDSAIIDVNELTPFLTSAPVYLDHAPRVELEPGPGIAHVNDRVILRWSVEDDGPVVAQRIEYSPAISGIPFSSIATLGPAERSWEYQVQSVPPSNLNSPAALRVVAIDEVGNESWDFVQFWVPYQDDWTVPDIQVNTPGQGLRTGDFFPVSWSPGATSEIFLEVGSESTLARIPSGGGNGAAVINKRTPYASTDLARIMIRHTFGAGGREAYYFSDYFSVRPDPRIADNAPPAINVTSPQAGQSFAGGGTVPIAWTASDDEGLRDFDIQASYDGGRTWWSVARHLPPNTTSFAWHLPGSIGITGVRVRVIARDVRFQTTSSGGQIAFSITPGAGVIPGDIDGDGDVDFEDLSLVVGVLTDANADPVHASRTDLTNDGRSDGLDVQPFVHALIGG